MYICRMGLEDRERERDQEKWFGFIELFICCVGLRCWTFFLRCWTWLVLVVNIFLRVGFYNFCFFVFKQLAFFYIENLEPSWTFPLQTMLLLFYQKKLKKNIYIYIHIHTLSIQKIIILLYININIKKWNGKT